jgi:ERCC4-type nuclease
MLLIDFREREFINKLNNFIKTENDKEMFVKINNIDLTFKICSLPVGDFVIMNSTDANVNANVNANTDIDVDVNTDVNDNTDVDIDVNNSKRIDVIIERKTLSDLSSSIIDGRFREQKGRLLESVNDPCKILYIIENNKNKVTVSENVLQSAIINLIFKHGYKMLQTKDNNDTFNNVLLLYKKVRNGEINNTNNSNIVTRMISKSDKLKANIFVNQLCIIPGVSQIIAESIKNKYINMNNLISEWNKLDQIKEKEMMLMNIHVTDKRKIGKALSKKIFDAHNS